MVLIQSASYAICHRRVVAHVVRKAVLGKASNPRFDPSLKIENVQVVLHPLETASVPSDPLGEYVASLSPEGIPIDAIDEFLTEGLRVNWWVEPGFRRRP